VSQVRVFSVTKDTAVRTDNNTGCGNSKHIYVGRYGTDGGQYVGYVQFGLDWTNVANIVSATLNYYTDEFTSFGLAGEPGIMPQPGAHDSPLIGVYRLTSAFTVGNNTDTHFDSSDYTGPAHTTSGGKNGHPSKAPDVLNHLDITSIVKAWAPSTVAGGGKATNHGILIKGSSDTTANISLWSSKHTGGGGVSERMTITLVFEYGLTTPDIPSGLAPSGAIASLTAFSGHFSDIKTTDTLQSTAIEIYDGGVACTAAASTDYVARANHGLHVGDVIYFTALTGGAPLSGFTPYRVYAIIDSGHFYLQQMAGGTHIPITTDMTAGTYSKRAASFSKVATESERNSATFIVDPLIGSFVPATGVTYRWRARVTDQEGATSGFSSLLSFNLTDTLPNAPAPLTPFSGSSFDTFNLLTFQGPFSDPDAGDYLMAHQVQLSPYIAGDIRWDEADGILWDSGKVYDPFGATDWSEPYGGRALVAGTYYWRARVWDQKDGVSAWTYMQIILTADFNPDPGTAYSTVQIDPNAPWRILIRDLYQPDGVTKTVGRAPGNLIAVLEEAKNVGASLVYNSPGELHFTLLKDDEQISVIEPKQVHYAVEFYSGDGWQEKFAGVVWETDATETDVVFKGIDYLALYDTVLDERYDPLKPNKSYASGGSFYDGITLRNIVIDQLNRAKGLTDSWVGFIAIGTIAAMDEKTSVYSTMQPTLSFVSGLIDSHRQGTGKRTRMKVVKTSTGTYELQIVDDPGIIRTDLSMYYGELVQGYRIIVFGDGWANVQHVVGRNRDGAKVVYQTIANKPFQPLTSVYGRIATVAVMDGVQDQNDLTRRGLQAAIQSAKLGKNIAIGIRTEFLAPLQGWDITDVFPMKIDDGAINTDNFGSGFWAAMACAWEATDIGEQSLIITFLPREDASLPDPDLIPNRPISTQGEWQLGWIPPDPITGSLTASSLRLSLDTGHVMDAGDHMDDAHIVGSSGNANIYVDMSTGLSYELQEDGTWDLVSGQPTLLRPESLIVASRKTLTDAGVTVTNVTVTVG
jgi:hypothetical protein